MFFLVFNLKHSLDFHFTVKTLIYNLIFSFTHTNVFSLVTFITHIQALTGLAINFHYYNKTTATEIARTKAKIPPMKRLMSSWTNCGTIFIVKGNLVLPMFTWPENMLSLITDDILNDLLKDTTREWFILIKSFLPALSQQEVWKP